MRRQVRLVALLVLGLSCARASAPMPDAGDPWVATLDRVPAGAAVTLHTRGGFHLNPDYPVSFTPDVASTAGLLPTRVELMGALVKSACEGSEKLHCAASAPLPLATAPEHARVSGVLAFGVCDEHQCLIPKVALWQQW